MSSLKDIMDVDVEPLESQAYRRSRQAAQQQPSPSPIAPSSETPSPPIDDDNKGKNPLRRRRSNRVSKPATQPTAVRQNLLRRRSSVAEVMDFTGYQPEGSNQASTSESPHQSLRGSEQATEVPVKYTPVTGRISRAKKGVPVHTCDICRPVKTFTRAEHLRRHQLSHQKPEYPCTFEDCERAFHRPDLLARHLHRHETQGEKAYKAGDPRSRASSSASESRTPSLKVETPSQGAANHTSPTDSITPRTGGSGESSMTASSFNTIPSNFQAVNFSAGSGTSNKRSAGQAQLPETGSYQPARQGSGSRPSGNYNQMTSQSNFSRGESSQFDGVYSEAGNSHFTSYSTTPQLPLLRIPEEIYTPGLSHTQENSPWCSSASDSNYSTQSDGPRNFPQWTQRGRSASIATIPDWPATTTHWSSNAIPQDLRSPPFESMLDHCDTPYMSPRMTPPSRGQHLLDVPGPGSSFGGICVEPVGTPAFSTYIKPMAQHFSASAPRTSNSGAATPSRRPKEMVLEMFNIDAMTMPSYGTPPQLDSYLSSYWHNFHPLCPIVHRPTFDRTEDNLLKSAMAAIGTQYHDSPEARATGSELNEACRKGIELCLNWSTQTMQTILLTELFARFRGRKTIVRLSRHFEALYSRLLNDFDQGFICQTMQTAGGTASANALIDRFGAQSNTEVDQNLNEHCEWYQWLERETRQRLLSACFMFDVHQAMYHQQCRFKAANDESKFWICLPASDEIWNANNASEWQIRRSEHADQPLRLVEQELSAQNVITMSTFSQSLSISWFVSNLPPRQDPTYPNDFVPHATHPTIQTLMALFPDSLHAHTYLALYHTPLLDLLAIAGDTWVFAQKITPPSAFHSAQYRLKTWSTSLAAAQATHHACKVLSESLTQTWTPSTDANSSPIRHVSDYWMIYVSALICWAFGHRYHNSSSGGSGSISRSNSSTAIGAMDIDEDPISDSAQLRALKYANDMLELSVEELLTSKAGVKCDTTGVIDAVRQQLEFESVGSKSGLLVDAVTVLTKIKEGGRTNEGGRTKWF